MTICLGKSCLFGQLCVSFMGVGQVLCASFFPFCIKSGVWDMIVLIPDPCLSIHFTIYYIDKHFVAIIVISCLVQTASLL